MNTAIKAPSCWPQTQQSSDNNIMNRQNFSAPHQGYISISSREPSLLGAGLPFPAAAAIDRLVAQAMLDLTKEEREKAVEEVHGIVQEGNEDPDFINSCLDDLENHLETIKKHTAYDLAEKMSKEYVSSNRLRMMFLRAMRYVPHDAAERMIGFFEYKKELFGVEKLVKDITLQDLSEEDLAPLKAGYVQLSPYTDVRGRPIMFFCEKVKQSTAKAAENAIRTQFYVYMSVLESDEAQKLGVVGVYYNLDCHEHKSCGSQLRDSLPVHFASIHFCVNNETQYSGIQLPMQRLGSNIRSRYRKHDGNNAECLEKMIAFGIPKGSLPITQEGHILLQDHTAWMKARRQIEEARARTPAAVVSSTSSASISSKVSLIPCPGDILFGRGRKVRDHPGNARFLQMVDTYMHKYESAGRVDKACIAEIIVRMVQDAGGRFLKRDENDIWEQVDDSVARKKVAHAFRNRRKLHGFGH